MVNSIIIFRSDDVNADVDTNNGYEITNITTKIQHTIVNNEGRYVYHPNALMDKVLPYWKSYIYSFIDHGYAPEYEDSYSYRACPNSYSPCIREGDDGYEDHRSEGEDDGYQEDDETVSVGWTIEGERGGYNKPQDDDTMNDDSSI